MESTSEVSNFEQKIYIPIGYAVPNRYQHRMNLQVPKNVRCQHRIFGVNLALIWHLCWDCSYMCQIDANIGNLVLIWLRFGSSLEIAVTCTKSVPTLEILCWFGSDLAPVWRLQLAYAKSVPTSERRCQVKNQLFGVGTDLASEFGLKMLTTDGTTINDHSFLS